MSDVVYKTSDQVTATEIMALAETVGWAVHTFLAYPAAWARLRDNGMRRDWSWTRAAGEYESLYQDLLR